MPTGKPVGKRKGGEEWIYSCPSAVCQGRPPRLELNVRTGVFHCFRCGRSGRKKLTTEDRKRMGRLVRSDRETAQGRAIVPVPVSLHGLFKARGLDAENVIPLYQVGWDGMRLCWPMGDPEAPDYYVRRAVYSFQDPKVMTDRHEEGSLGGLHLIRKGSVVVVTEGEFKAASIPLPWVGVHITGVELSGKQRDQILKARPSLVVDSLDGGVAGRVKRKLAGRVKCVVARWPSGKGPDDVPMAERIKGLMEAK